MGYGSPHLVIPGLLCWVFGIFYGNPVYDKSGGILRELDC